MKLADAKPGPLPLVDLGPPMEDIPPRPWVVPGLAMRGIVSFVVGRGGAAKSLFALQLATMVTRGEPWAHWEPRETGPVLLLNAEDDETEQQRRLHGVQAVQGRPRELYTAALRNLVLVALTEGEARETELFQRLRETPRETRPALVVLDPLIELHAGLDENSNGDMMKVIEALRWLARETDTAILVVHHGKKGASAGDQDGARGASAIINACRSAVTIEPMPREDAEKLLPDEEQGEYWRYVRVTSAKQNYAPREGDKWLRLRSVPHTNGETYPALEQPAMGDVVDPDAALRLIDGNDWRIVSTGPKKGRLDAELARHMGLSPQKASDLAQQLLRDGRIVPQEKWVDGNKRTFARVAQPIQDDIPF